MGRSGDPQSVFNSSNEPSAEDRCFFPPTHENYLSSRAPARDLTEQRLGQGLNAYDL